MSVTECFHADKLSYILSDRYTSTLGVGWPAMPDDDEMLMDFYGITSDTKTIYYYQGHSYNRLEDAISYAKKTVNVGESEPPEQKNILTTIKHFLS